MSNSKSWNELFAPIRAKYRENVLRDTWGHLAPEKNKSFKVKILFSVSCYCSGTRNIIDTNLENGLEDSPWLYDAMEEEINKLDIPENAPGVYLLQGTFRNFRFYGKPKKLYTLN